MDLQWRHFWVAVDVNGRVIGCCQVKTHGDGSRELASLVVIPDYRGKGIARALIEKNLDENQPPLYLTCRASLQSLYEKFGFAVLPPAQMPPYFRRIWWLFSRTHRLFPRSEGLLVMVRDRDPVSN